MNKPKVYIDGKEGTTGLQIYERLGGRTDIELLLIDEDKRKDTAERKKLINAGLDESILRHMDPDDRVAILEQAKLDPYDYIYLAC